MNDDDGEDDNEECLEEYAFVSLMLYCEDRLSLKDLELSLAQSPISQTVLSLLDDEKSL